MTLERKIMKVVYTSIEGSNWELERKTYSGTYSTLDASSRSTVNMYIFLLGSLVRSSKMSPCKIA
jgi:hypothetical protein